MGWTGGRFLCALRWPTQLCDHHQRQPSVQARWNPTIQVCGGGCQPFHHRLGTRHAAGQGCCSFQGRVNQQSAHRRALPLQCKKKLETMAKFLISAAASIYLPFRVVSRHPHWKCWQVSASAQASLQSTCKSDRTVCRLPSTSATSRTFATLWRQTLATSSTTFSTKSNARVLTRLKSQIKCVTHTVVQSMVLLIVGLPFSFHPILLTSCERGTFAFAAVWCHERPQ